MTQMDEMIKCRKTKKSGFTLGETLLAILIVALVGTIVIAGIPAAKNAYDRVVVSSNAEVLYSTTVTMLRNELGTAQKIELNTGDKGIIYYSPTRGTLSKIYISDDNIMFNRYYSGIGNFGDDPVKLISSKTATGDLYVTYSNLNYADGIITISGLSVKRESAAEPLVSRDSLSIRVISN